jgi:hypothetical protein
MLIVVCGSIGRSVTGGQAWANLQYLIGLRALGHDVYYLEDVGDWSRTYSWEEGQHTDSLDYPSDFIRRSLEPYGFGDRWAYRVGRESRGRSIEEIRALCAEADLLLVRGIPFIVWRPDYDLPRRRAFIDVDPGFTQVRLANGEPAFAETLGKCERLFTISQRIGKPDCDIPAAGRVWNSTLPPVALEAWPVTPAPKDAPFTSVIRWRGFKDVKYRGKEYGQRDREFPKFIDLPAQSRQSFQIALTGGGAEKLTKAGWKVVEGWRTSRTTESYRSFIQDSRAEFGVAKHCYVATRGGWFSDRSVCYLASGRPVLVQDTGLGWLPLGSGVLTYATAREAIHQIECINADYRSHQTSARALATTLFSTKRVLPQLLNQAMD